MVAEVRPDYPSDWPAIKAVAGKLGIGSAETLRKWVRRAEVDGGTRPGVTSEESAEIKRLKRENAELRRANDPQGGLGSLRGRARPPTAVLVRFIGGSAYETRSPVRRHGRLLLQESGSMDDPHRHVVGVSISP
jgi:transposase